MPIIRRKPTNGWFRVPTNFGGGVSESEAKAVSYIYYKTTDGAICEPTTTVFGSANVVSNEYYNGCGRIGFDAVLTEIPEKAFYSKNTLYAIILPDTVEDIKKYSFQFCTNLTYADLGNVKNIYEYALEGCSNLTHVELGESLQSIGMYCFDACTAIQYIRIPSTIQYIHAYAFENCSNLNTIQIDAETAPDVSIYAFGNSTTNVCGCNTRTLGTNRLVVPKGSTGYDTTYWTVRLLSSKYGGFTTINGFEDEPFWIQPLAVSTENTIEHDADAPDFELWMSRDGSTWTSLGLMSSGITFDMPDLGRYYFKATYQAFSCKDHSNKFNIQQNFNVGGNIMSLISGNAYKSTSIMNNDYALADVFMGSKVVNAYNLVLPTEIVSIGGYFRMFKDCTNLVTPPVMKCTTLQEISAYRMFEYDMKLMIAPDMSELTTIYKNAMYSMFYYCSFSSFKMPNITYMEDYGSLYSAFGNCANLSYFECKSSAISSESMEKSVWLYGNAGGYFVTSKECKWADGAIPSQWTRVND